MDTTLCKILNDGDNTYERMLTAPNINSVTSVNSITTLKANALAVYMFGELVKDTTLPQEEVERRYNLAVDRANLFLNVMENGDIADMGALLWVILSRNGYAFDKPMHIPKETAAIKKMRSKVEEDASATRGIIIDDSLLVIRYALQLVNCKLVLRESDKKYIFLTYDNGEVLYEEVTPDMECFVYRLGNAIYEKISDPLFADVKKYGIDKYCTEDTNIVCNPLEYKDEAEDFCLAVAFIGQLALTHNCKAFYDKYEDYFDVCRVLSSADILDFITLDDILRHSTPTAVGATTD